MNASEMNKAAFRPAIIAPTFNNGGTLGDVLKNLAHLAIPIFVVNDGSTDDTAGVLSEWQSRDIDRSVMTHTINRGKAAALHTGFAVCVAEGFTHAITIDTDGQHSPNDVPNLMTAARENPFSLVLGARDERCEAYPIQSRWGRRISNFFVRLECGQRVEDSQCGLRVYPLREVLRSNCSAGHYGFETEVITRASWNGVPIVSVPVECLYLPMGQRVSHFRPWLDSLRALAMHARLLLLSVSPSRSSFSFGRLRRHVRQSIRGINPLTAWRTVRNDAVGRTDFAVGFALGVFIANLPLYGLQTLLGLFTARRLHLNPFSVVAGTQLSMPPLGPVLIAAAIFVGHAILHGSMLSWSIVQSQLHAHVAGLLGSVVLDWIVGSVCVGSVLAIGAFVLLKFLLNAAFGRVRDPGRWANASVGTPATGGAE